MKCILILFGITFFQIGYIKCVDDTIDKIAQCSADLLIPYFRLEAVKNSSMDGYCRTAKYYKKIDVIDDNLKVNEENLKAYLEKNLKDKDKLEIALKRRMECIPKDIKEKCEFVGVWILCTNSIIRKSKNEKKQRRK
ncbi:uncharacterized protein LOC122503820 [Leptopilina heterotoma]|uniref:uncharacterized protein LOC122503820 n=1 Tax=Leptopilina heterotoma TaxID=63436 RepID=UPI001CA974F6|nr:uncharacterized protein LOC122503820 [Leptopilina heterotoma]